MTLGGFEESSDIGPGLAILKPDTKVEIKLRIRDEAGNDPVGQILTLGEASRRLSPLFLATVDCPVNVHLRRGPSRFESSEATRCLVIQTDHPRLVRAALEALKKPGLYPGCKLALACRQEDFESFQDLPDVELLTFPRRGNYRIMDFWRRISEFSPHLICAVFNRRPVFRKQKFLFFLLPVRQRLILDGQMHPFYFRLRTIPAILRRSRYEGSLSDKESTILFLPTAEDSPVLDVLGRLQDREIVGAGQIRVFCSKAKKTLFESRPDVSEVVTYEPGQTLANLSTILKLARMRVDVLAAIFSGRPTFRLHKLMFLLLPARSRLVFNEHRDCWYLRRSPRGLAKLWRTPSMRLFRWESTILFLPTEADSCALAVLERLQDRKIVGAGQIRVFCSKAKKTLFESRPDVSEVVTYEPGQTLANLWTILKLARMRVDVLAGIFSGRPIFRLHKLMFLLLPARSRLVFNEHRDCWHLRRTPRGLLKLSNTLSVKATYLPRYMLRQILKGVLFFPRYLYLVLWLLLGSLRKGGSRRLVVFRKNAFGTRDFGEYD